MSTQNTGDNKPTIAQVGTFVAELPGLPLAAVLGKFKGRVTPRTIAAARRIAASPRKVKLPRNLLRQLWRISGGWHPEMLKSCQTTGPDKGKSGRLFGLGDMEVFVANEQGGYPPRVWLRMRGIWVASMLPEWQKGWLDPKKVESALSCLGEPWTVPQQ